MVLNGKAPAVEVNTDSRNLLDDAYRKHVDKIYRYCLFRTNSFADAEDITSETFIKFLKSNRSPSELEEALPWLYKVAGNLCINHNRRSALGRELNARAGAVSERQEDPWRNKEVWSVMRHLKPIEQQVVYLKAVEDLSFRRTAELVSKREGAVKMIFYRAVKRLQGVLSKEGY